MGIASDPAGELGNGFQNKSTGKPSILSRVDHWPYRLRTGFVPCPRCPGWVNRDCTEVARVIPGHRFTLTRSPLYAWRGNAEASVLPLNRHHPAFGALDGPALYHAGFVLAFDGVNSQTPVINSAIPPVPFLCLQHPKPLSQLQKKVPRFTTTHNVER